MALNDPVPPVAPVVAPVVAAPVAAPAASQGVATPSPVVATIDVVEPIAAAVTIESLAAEIEKIKTYVDPQRGKLV